MKLTWTNDNRGWFSPALCYEPYLGSAKPDHTFPIKPEHQNKTFDELIAMPEYQPQLNKEEADGQAHNTPK